MQKWIQYAACLLLLALAGCQSWKSEVLMPFQNPGFEGAGVDGLILPGWEYQEHAGPWHGRAFEVASDSGVGPGNRSALRVTRIHEEVYSFVHQKFRIRPEDAGKKMRFSAMLKTDKVGPTGWKLVVNMVNGSTNLGQFLSMPVTGTSGWSSAVVTGVIPMGATDIDVGFLHMDAGIGWAAAPVLVIE